MNGENKNRKIKFVGGRALLSESPWRPFQYKGAVHKVADKWGYADPDNGVFLALYPTELEAQQSAADLYKAELIQ